MYSARTNGRAEPARFRLRQRGERRTRPLAAAFQINPCRQEPRAGRSEHSPAGASAGLHDGLAKAVEQASRASPIGLMAQRVAVSHADDPGRPGGPEVDPARSRWNRSSLCVLDPGGDRHRISAVGRKPGAVGFCEHAHRLACRLDTLPCHHHPSKASASTCTATVFAASPYVATAVPSARTGTEPP